MHTKIRIYNIQLHACHAIPSQAMPCHPLPYHSMPCHAIHTWHHITSHDLTLHYIALHVITVQDISICLAAKLVESKAKWLSGVSCPARIQWRKQAQRLYNFVNTAIAKASLYKCWALGHVFASVSRSNNTPLYLCSIPQTFSAVTCTGMLFSMICDVCVIYLLDHSEPRMPTCPTCRLSFLNFPSDPSPGQTSPGYSISHDMHCWVLQNVGWSTLPGHFGGALHDTGTRASAVGSNLVLILRGIEEVWCLWSGTWSTHKM